MYPHRVGWEGCHVTLREWGQWRDAGGAGRRDCWLRASLKRRQCGITRRIVEIQCVVQRSRWGREGVNACESFVANNTCKCMQVLSVENGHMMHCHTMMRTDASLECSLARNQRPSKVVGKMTHRTVEAGGRRHVPMDGYGHNHNTRPHHLEVFGHWADWLDSTKLFCEITNRSDCLGKMLALLALLATCASATVLQISARGMACAEWHGGGGLPPGIGQDCVDHQAVGSSSPLGGP